MQFGTRWLWLGGVVALVACGPNNKSGNGHSDAPGGSGGDGGMHDDGGSSSGSDGGSSGSGTAITCPSPGTPTDDGSACGTERWDIKTGTDTQAPSLSLVPQPNTIAALVALPAAGSGSSRESPTEDTLYELADVTLTELKEESDSDYHLVISDGAHTMIAEIPWPACGSGSPWQCFMSRARSEVDAKYKVTTSPQYPSVMITVRGFGFFDYLHGQNGVAPNAIELHPVLQICFGEGCTPT
jgi:hypothetical protein